MSNSSTTRTVDEHFEGRDPAVKATYAKILAAARRLGPFHQEPKKTSIHLARTTAFAGVATRKAALILTLKSSCDIASKRIAKQERASANRWYIEIRLERPEDVDRQIISWLKAAYALAK
jgi:predicted DNA-binding protein (MmcQ/YjbR family)